MNYARVYTDDRGETHFEDLSVETAASGSAPPGAEPLLVSKPIATANVLLFEAPDNWDYSWHPAPRRQYVVGVSGSFEIEVSDGERRRVEPGDIVLLEDTSGKGHHSRALAGPTARGMFIQLPE